MIQIDFPEPGFKIKKEGGVEFIFDFIRKKWIVLTPEEWVRQNFIQYLVQAMKYPQAMIAVEKELQLGELKKRFDVLVYNKFHNPWMMVECKASQIELNETVLQQVLRYNISIPCSFLVITNGLLTHAWERKENQFLVLNSLPDWV